MAIINRIENTASINYNKHEITSLPVETLLLVLPTILKSVDKQIASIGEILTYTILITNVGLTTIKKLSFLDVIPVGTTYVLDSFKLNGSIETPTINESTLTFIIPNIAPLGTATITFDVQIIGGEI